MRPSIMPFDPEIHHRRSIRLDGRDYAGPGAYFITICARSREPLFGAVRDGGAALNPWGLAAEEEWARSAAMRAEIELDAFVVMPNHVHGIVIIKDYGQLIEPPIDVDVGATGGRPGNTRDRRNDERRATGPSPLRRQIGRAAYADTTNAHVTIFFAKKVPCLLGALKV